MNEANQAYARKLLALAEVYNRSAEPLPEPTFYVHAYKKSELLTQLRTFGGSWKKELSSYSDDIRLVSQALPLTLTISRDKVCKKTVTWDCEPMFSPAEEKELDAELFTQDVPVQVPADSSEELF